MSAEVLVIGAGPAGMAAAAALAERGVQARVVDEQVAPGGQVYRAVERVHADRPAAAAMLGDDYAVGLELVARFRSSGALFSPRTSVWDIEPGAAAPTVGLGHAGRLEMISPGHLVIAAGAMERPTPFPGWTLPGVMGVGAAQTLLKESGLVPRGPVVVAGSGPLVHLFVHQMVAAGAPPAAVLDTGSADHRAEALGALLASLPGSAPELAKGLDWMVRARRAGLRRVRGVTGLRALGTGALEAVEFRRGAERARIEAGVLLVHDGVIPNVHLAMAAGCDHRWNPLQAYWEPRVTVHGETTVPGITVVGDAGGIAGAKVAPIAGRLAGMRVAHRLGRLDDEALRRETGRAREAAAPARRLRRFLDAFYRPAPLFQLPADPSTLACRCEEVTVGEIREVARMGCVGPNQGKAFTRCGMGPCMGRECGATVSNIIADHHGLPLAEVGHYRIRPPLRPITVGQLAELDTGG